MKKIAIIILCFMLCIMLTGCTQVNKSENSPSYTYAMIIMPDGSIIKGKCEDYMRYSNNWMTVQINGTTYHLNDWRVTLYK